MCRSDTGETKTLQKRAFTCAAVGTYFLLRFLHALQKASTHLFPTLSPPPSPLLPLCLNLFIWLLYLTLFNLFHRRASHLRSGDYIASAFVCFVYLWICIVPTIRVKTRQQKSYSIKADIGLAAVSEPRSFICCSFFMWEQFYKYVL